MPMYSFYCSKCDYSFEDLCGFNEIGSVRCEKCNKKPKQQFTTPRAITFTNPKGTSLEDNFEYVAKYNHERAQGERRAAEAANKWGPAYKDIDDSKFDGKIS